MSKNTITSYFKPVSVSKDPKPVSRKRPIIDSDDEESTELFTSKRSKKNDKKSRVLSDSEDESPKKKPVNKETRDEKTKKVETVVSTKELFGKTPIKRVAAPKVVRKVKEPVKLKTESEYHDDDGFENALEQLDTSKISSDESPPSNDTKPEKKIEKSPKKASKMSETEDEKPSKKPKIENEKKLNLSKLKKPESPTKPDVKKETRSSPRKTKDKKADKTATSSKTSYKVEVEKHSPKKKKDAKDDDPLQTILEKKKQSAALYNSYLHRGGARNPGSKEIPEGKEYCLAGLRFLLTGVYDSLERDEAGELIQKYGGFIVHAVSKKLDYLVVGNEAGPSKIQKAESLKIKQINEDGLLDLIRTRPAGKASAVIQPHKKKEDKSDVSFEIKQEHVETNEETKKIEPFTSSDKTKEAPVNKTSFKKVVPKVEPKVEKTESKMSFSEFSGPPIHTKALVEKYRPKTMKEIIGQQDSNSNAIKLYKWLSSWHKARKNPPPQKAGYGGALHPDIYKAVLLSGPPGIGKTTTAEVVCKELGFEFIEFNASDTRSKRLLNEEVAGILSNTTVSNYFQDKSKQKVSPKHVLIMDEVDGMSGNQDRGGVQELVTLIKNTSIPIICICNDRNNPKMRTLSKYTYELRFTKPKLLQIRAAMLSLCHKEGIKIAKEDLDQLIISTDQDVRQVINHLALHGAGTEFEKNTNNKSKHKDIRLGIWEVARKVFSAEDHKNMSIHDKSDLFFHDYNISPLFVHENYLNVVPNAPKSELMSRMAEAAESIAIGDLVDNAIRKNNAWSLLPTQAMFSSVIPGSVLSGRVNTQIGFPNWLGKNSRRNKQDRMLQEISAHSRVTTGVSKEAINLDYAKLLRDRIVRPLVVQGTAGIQETIENMNAYHLLREDLESLIEVSLWPGDRDPMQSVESKTKAAFTRAFNKQCAYAGSVTKKKKGASVEDEGYGLEEDEEYFEDDEEEDDDITNDKMIKAKKPAASKPSTSKTSKESKPSTRGGTRGRGRGRGKA